LYEGEDLSALLPRLRWLPRELLVHGVFFRGNWHCGLSKPAGANEEGRDLLEETDIEG